MDKMIKINTVLELYDWYIVEQLKTKHYSTKNANWFYAPPQKEIGFRYAEEKFGKNKIFPIFFVFRNEPAKPTGDNTSYAKYKLNWQLSEEADDEYRSASIIMVKLEYQIDFYSNSMYDMNLHNIDYFRFRQHRNIKFDFSDVAVNYVQDHEVFFDDIEANHTIQDMFEVGRYYVYTYRINVMVPLFDVRAEIPVEKVTLGVYSEGNSGQILQFTQQVK